MGVTCLGLCEGHDIAANHAIASSRENSIVISFFDSANAPYLEVTHTIIAPAVIKIDGGTLKIN
ncbi:MAG: hypothetical protein PHW95_00060 [Patescibacteria group bacterium]|nr:hypothetical protein [Patescibacteria group bacterium]